MTSESAEPSKAQEEPSHPKTQENASSHQSSEESNVSVQRLLALAKPEWKTLLVGFFFLIIASGVSLLYPQAIRVIIDSTLKTTKDVTRINQAALAMLAIFLVQGFTGAMRYYLFTIAGERIVARLRQSLYQKIILQEVAFFDERRTGELTNRLASDTTVLQNTVSVNISMALRNFASVVGGIGFLLYTSASLTTVILFVIPPVALGAVFYGRKIRKYSRDVQDALASASEIAEETISGVRTVRAFSQESNESKRYGEAIDHSFELSKKRARITAVFSAVITSAGYGAIALVFWYGGHLVVKGGMSVGDLTSFVLYTLIVAVSFGTLGGLYADFMRASGAAERVFALIDRIPTIPNEQGQQLPNLKGEVTLKDIDFRYPSRPDIPVLKGISLSIKPGEVVALVGPSGGGKSTIAALISRLYDPDKGDVIFDEHNVKELDPTWLRRQIGVVPQEPILFSTTIADNIRYGREDASEEELIAAAKAANAHDFIMTFPDGYQTTVGERGVQLSGGQKQRVAIARAVLKDPRVLLLDEATSALDAESEFLVKEALDRLMEGRTTLVIAHRLSTVKDATRVIVLDQGAVAESGSHDELFQEDGLYRRLVERQMVD